MTIRSGTIRFPYEYEMQGVSGLSCSVESRYEDTSILIEQLTQSIQLHLVLEKACPEPWTP